MIIKIIAVGLVLEFITTMWFSTWKNYDIFCCKKKLFLKHISEINNIDLLLFEQTTIKLETDSICLRIFSLWNQLK